MKRVTIMVIGLLGVCGQAEALTLTKTVLSGVNPDRSYEHNTLPNDCVSYLNDHYSQYTITKTNFSDDKISTTIELEAVNLTPKEKLAANDYFPATSTVDLKTYYLGSLSKQVKAEKAVALNHQRNVGAVKSVVAFTFVGIPMILLLTGGFLGFVAILFGLVATALNPNENIIVRVVAGYTAYKLTT